MSGLADNVVLYTDGSAYQSHGGWAALVCLFKGEELIEVEISGHAYPTTNNRMEMQAAIEGLKMLDEPTRVHLVTDSAYVLNTLEQKWYLNWSRPETRPNWDLWLELIALTDLHHVEYVKVKGHEVKSKQDPFNDQVDKLAGQARVRGMEKHVQVNKT